MKYLTVFIMGVLMLGCATPYQSKSEMGGYSESQLATNVFQVTFRGNGYTERERATDFTLLRSAELTLEKGYRYFIILDNKYYTKDVVHTTPVTSYTTGSVNTYGTLNTYGNYGTYSGSTYGSMTTTTFGGNRYVISKPRTSNTILLLRSKPRGNHFVYDAVLIKKSLRQKYNLNG